MSWGKTAVSHLPERRPESEYKRMRAYESLAVVVVVIAVVLVCASSLAIGVVSSLGQVARSLGQGS